MKRISNFRGYWIIQSCGYYYPEVNTNMESKDIMEVKEYLERCYIPAMDNIKNLLGLE